MSSLMAGLVNVIIVVTTVSILVYTNSYVVVDAILQIVLYEINARRNHQHRKSRTDELNHTTTKDDVDRQHSSGFVACVIAYREDSIVLERCLRSYIESAQNDNCRAFVLGIDGNEDADMIMYETLQKVFGTESTRLIEFDEPLGMQADLHCQRYRAQERDPDRTEECDEHEESALRILYSTVEEALHSDRRCGPFATGVPKDKCFAVCLSQPHVGIKEIRFATWLTSMVLASALRVQYMWSSDSDSFVQPGIVSLAVDSIADCTNVGAASVALGVHNQNATLISRLCASQFRSHIYLDKACPAAIGESTVVTGPSALFRTKALIQVIMPWYRQRIFGYRTDINEDAHVASQLGLHGWERRYISDAVVLTEAKTTMMPWLKQQIRWKRSGHLERVSQPLYIFTQGPVFLWWRAREVFLETLLFAEILSYTIAGKFILSSISGPYAISIVTLSIYNTIRSPEQLKDLQILPLSIVFHAILMPFAHVWAACTILEDSWGVTDRGISLKRELKRAAGGLSSVGIASCMWAVVVTSFVAKLAVAVIGMAWTVRSGGKPVFH